MSAATAGAPDPKPALRVEARRLRRALHAALPRAGEEAALHYARARRPPPRTAAVYAPCGSELDPGPLTAHLRAAGARLALPAVLAPGDPLVFRRREEGAPLFPDGAGASAPGPDAPQVEPDLVVAPLLAFDRSGARLGQGGGWYDRTLAALRARSAVFVLGLAYAGQEVDVLPREAHDQRLDAVLTEAGLRLFIP